MLKCGGIFDLAGKEKEVEKLEESMAEGTFWDDPESAQGVLREVNLLKGWINPMKDVERRFQAVQELIEEIDPKTDTEILAEIATEVSVIDTSLRVLEVRKMLRGEMDDKDCYLSINAGAGGTESCDWVLMLSRMYQRWFSQRGWKFEIVDQLDGDVAGLKRITFSVTGPYAYGFTKSEKGVHRLVRISPFDSNARRHTSFASVDVMPQIADDVDITIAPDDIRVDTYRSSGAGGQHVNTTDSAVRITHIPTQIVVTCQKERSQIQNKETCMKMLRSKLYERHQEEREEEMKKLSGEKKKIEWGSQIRSYVFQPYTLVKDLRTKYEDGNIEKVMDGSLDGFVEAYLQEFG